MAAACPAAVEPGSANSTPTDQKAAGAATHAPKDKEAEKPKELTEDERREKQRSDLQAKLDAEVKKIADLRKANEDAQRDLNDLTNYSFGGQRATLAQTVEKNNQEIAQAEQTIADLQEQARRAGMRLNRP